MRGLFANGRSATEGAQRIDQFFRTQRSSATFTLITKSTIALAGGASSFDVSIGQKGICFGIEILFRLLRLQLTRLFQLRKEGGGCFVMQRIAGAVIDVELNGQVGKILPHRLMIFVNDGLSRGSFLAGLDGDGRSVLIAAADKHDIPTLRAQVTGINIGRDISACQVTYVLESVGIRQGSRNEISFGAIHGEGAKIPDWHPRPKLPDFG